MPTTLSVFVTPKEDESVTLSPRVRLNLLAIPDPIIIKCDIYKWERCLQSGSHGWVTYTESRSNAVEVDYGNSSVNVKALAIWTATVYIKARHGDYVKWKMEINGEPVVELTRIDLCSAVKTKDGYFHKPDAQGRYTLRVLMTEEESRFIRLTSIIVL